MNDKADVFEKVITHIEHITGKDHSYARISPQIQRSIYSLIDVGHTLVDFNGVIEKKWEQWKGTKFEAYVRAETLFGDKFKIYLHERTIRRLNNIEKLSNAVSGAKYALRKMVTKSNGNRRSNDI